MSRELRVVFQVGEDRVTESVRIPEGASRVMIDDGERSVWISFVPLPPAPPMSAMRDFHNAMAFELARQKLRGPMVRV